METRHTNRLHEWDYRTNGAYFVTFCTQNRRCVLWDAVGATLGRPPLSAVGCIVEREINNISTFYPNAHVDKYVIMPNHVHLIIILENTPCIDGRPRVAPTVSQIIQQTKGKITKQAGFHLWQRSFHDHIIRNTTDYLNIWNYIDTNPLKWTNDCYYN